MPATPAASIDRARRERVERGDWQTPPALAQAVVELVARTGERFASVLEPTCGTGVFLAAARRFSAAQLVGFERSPSYVESARSRLAGTGASVTQADFFATDWASVIAGLPEPLLVLGNPPWVTNSTLGALAAENLPAKSNQKGETGFDALTGKSNFDISEWMLGRLLDVTGGRRFTLAMLCKTAVARRLLERCAGSEWELSGAVHAVDARAHFAATVAAVLLVVRGTGARARAASEPRWLGHLSESHGEQAHELDGRAPRARLQRVRRRSSD